MGPNAPEDMFISSGFYGRFIFVIPRLEIVIVIFRKKLIIESIDTTK
ncbi:MAG: hypothetical protein ACFFB0_04040 [Promethearchaeota archaeon]